MNNFAILFLAIIIEGVVTYVRQFVVDKKFQWQMLAALLLGVFAAIAYQVDLLALFGLTSAIPFVGCALTGVLISRGSNYLFDLFNLIGEFAGKAGKG